MQKLHSKLSINQELVAQSELELPDGARMITEVIKQGEEAIIIGQFYVPKGSKEALKQQWCGYCSGTLIGCVTCSNYTLNCVKGTISCD